MSNMSLFLGLIVLAALLLFGFSSFAKEGGFGQDLDGLKVGERGIVTEIVDGDTFFMRGGLKVRVSAMQAPKLPLGRKGFEAWPLGEEAKEALADRVLGKKIELRYGGERRDRYGRALAQVFVIANDGSPVWVQEDMIRAGMARVYTWPDTDQDTARLYAAEGEAREAARGIWGHDYYNIRNTYPDALAQDLDTFQLVEGIITSAADVRGRIYLNFGANYRTDFTISVEKRHRARFENAGIDLLGLEGAKVRVRGWIELQNGPAISLDDPDRLEILD